MKNKVQEEGNLSLDVKFDSGCQAPAVQFIIRTEHKTHLLLRCLELIDENYAKPRILKELTLIAESYGYNSDWFRLSLSCLLEEACKYSIWFKDQGIKTQNPNTKKDQYSLRVLTLLELFDKAEDEIQWSVQNLFPAHGNAIVSGYPGAGKTWILLSLALQIVQGGNWLGYFPVNPGTVLYLDAESSEELIKSRCKALIAGLGMTQDQFEGLHFATSRTIDLNHRSSLKEISGSIKKLLPDVIIFDSLIRFHSADENSAPAMKIVFRNLLELLGGHRCLCIFADHLRKPSQFDYMGLSKLRGSTEKSAFVDSHVLVSKRDCKLTITNPKLRQAKEHLPFNINIVDCEEDGILLEYSGLASTTKHHEQTKQAKIFLEDLLKPGEWIARQDILNSAKLKTISPIPVNRLLKNWEQDETIEKKVEKRGKGRGKPSHLYRLAPNDKDTNGTGLDISGKK